MKEIEMAREKQADIGKRMRSNDPPKLLIVGSGQLTDRRATLLRIRTDLTDEIKQHAVGPLYLLIDVALQRLIEDLKTRPPGSIEVIQAQDLDHGRLPPRKPA
jgi:hypothetical protein